jgi:hypothetical protein
MKPRLHLKPKTKVRVSASVRLVVAGAVFATLIAIGFLLYYNFGINTDTWASGNSRFSGYNWRMKISFDRTIIQTDEQMLNFPLLIELKNPDLRHISRGGKMIHLKGNDIRFSKSDGESPLISQIERYNPETGELLAWVMLDTLSVRSSNEIYLYFSRADHPAALSNVIWENDFQAVWHLSGSLNADNSRRIKATALGTTEIPGKIGSGRSFNPETGDCAFYPWLQELDLKEDISLSAWIFLNSQGRNQVILSNQGDQPGGYRLYIDQNNKVAFDFINAAGVRHGVAQASGGTLLEPGNWYHVAAVYSLADKSIRTYLNGMADRIAMTTDSPAPTASALQIGRDQFDPQSYFDGRLDELRLSRQVRSAGWIASEYYNQLHGTRLFQVAPAEELLMLAADIKANKNALQQLSQTEQEKKDAVNQLQAKKGLGSGSNPAPVSESAEMIKARLDNIRRVARENNKSK